MFGGFSEAHHTAPYRAISHPLPTAPPLPTSSRHGPPNSCYVPSHRLNTPRGQAMAKAPTPNPRPGRKSDPPPVPPPRRRAMDEDEYLARQFQPPELEEEIQERRQNPPRLPDPIPIEAMKFPPNEHVDSLPPWWLPVLMILGAIGGGTLIVWLLIGGPVRLGGICS